MFAKLEIFQDGAVFFVFGMTGLGVIISVVLPRGGGTGSKFHATCGNSECEDAIGIDGLGTSRVDGAAFSEAGVATSTEGRVLVGSESASGSAKPSLTNSLWAMLR